MFRNLKYIVIAMVLLFVALAVVAQEQAPPPSNQPVMRVARVAYMRGDASYLRGDAEGNSWTALGPNTPTMTGDAFYTPQGALVEINLGLGNVARMDAGTSVDLTSLTRDVTQLGLNSGRLSLRLRGLPPGGAAEVDTPGAAVTLQAPGNYLFSVSPQSALYAVFAGGLSISVGGQEVEVGAGDAVELEGGAYTFMPLPEKDDFIRWGLERDGAHERGDSRRYIHPDVVGYEDLDEAGYWRRTTLYGYLWFPGALRWGGLRTTAAGYGRTPMDGPGCRMNLGGGRPITMGDGPG